MLKLIYTAKLKSVPSVKLNVRLAYTLSLYKKKTILLTSLTEIKLRDC